MIDPKRIETKMFQPEDMLRIRGDTEVVGANARLNQVAGPAHSIFIDDKLVACGGVRIAGVGEAWACYSPEVLEHVWDVFKHTKANMEQVVREQNLWRVWAEMSVQDDKHRAFLKRLNFKQIEAYVR